MMSLQRNSAIAVMVLLLSACNGEAPGEPLVYPEAGSQTERFFQEKCGRCHKAPLPSAHISRLWPGVIQRMQMRMKASGVTVLNKNELVEILDYLQRHAAVAESK
jgi:hypothetical protein